MFKVFKLEKLNSSFEGRFLVSILVGIFVTLFLDTYVNIIDELLIPLLIPKLKNIVIVKENNKIKLGRVIMSVIKFVLFIILSIYIV
jgi:hypothetical protein